MALFWCKEAGLLRLILGFLCVLFIASGDEIVLGGGGGLLLRGEMAKGWNANGFVGYELTDNSLGEGEEAIVRSRLMLYYTNGRVGYERQMFYHSLDFVADWVIYENISSFVGYYAGLGAGYSYAMAQGFENYHAGNFLLRFGVVFRLGGHAELNLGLTTRVMARNALNQNLIDANMFLHRPSLQIYKGGLLALLPELSMSLVFKFGSPWESSALFNESEE